MDSLVYILFDARYNYLGEIFVEKNKFSHLTFNPRGEELLGEQFEVMQLRGVPILQEAKKNQQVTHDGRVLLRDEGFVDALRSWLHDQQYISFLMSMEALDCWEYVLSLPLDVDEMFALAEDLASVPAGELKDWRKMLEESVYAARQART